MIVLVVALLFLLEGILVAMRGVVTEEKLFTSSVSFPSVSPDSLTETLRESVEQAVYQVCRTLELEGRRAGCSVDSSFVWSFLPSERGSFSSLYTYPINGSFSCDSPGEYGRYLLLRSLPADLLSNFGWDKRGVTDKTDLCGFGDLVW